MADDGEQDKKYFYAQMPILVNDTIRLFPERFVVIKFFDMHTPTTKSL